MTEQRHEHSRSGAVSGHNARHGAGSLRTDAAAGEQPGADRQAFAGEGAFTGRPIPPQEPAPAPPADGQGQAAGHHPNPAGAGDELERLRADNAELTASLQRMAADFDNFRKRSRREIEHAASYASEKLIGELLTVLDDVDRAMLHIEELAGTSFAEGFTMVHQRLEQVLTAHGLAEIDATGTFDPHLHEAVGMQPQPGAPEGQILHVAQKGYRAGDRVIRHARVIVAGG